MSPNVWGPPIWTFFHTLAEKINPEKFHQVFPQLFNYISRICRVLPCPDCSAHASQFLQKVNPAGVRNKDDFRNIMCIFHNVVNRRKNKQQFTPDKLTTKYANNNPVVAFNNFVGVFHTKGNMKLLAETFQRKLVLTDFRKWFMQNAIFFFTKPAIQQKEIECGGSRSVSEGERLESVTLAKDYEQPTSGTSVEDAIEKVKETN